MRNTAQWLCAKASEEALRNEEGWAGLSLNPFLNLCEGKSVALPSASSP